MKFLTVLSCAAMAAAFSACGGGSSSSASAPGGPPIVVIPPETPVTPPVVTPPDTTPPPETPSRPDWFTLYNHCEHPRSGFQPNGLPYMDVQATLNDELRWMRSYIDDSYLWYNEIPASIHMADYKTPLDYFAVLKTPAITASGRPKDRFHFSYPSEVWYAMSNQGIELTYGITWSRTASGVLPRVWIIAMVEPGSPADAAGLRRGDRLRSVDGVDMQSTTTEGVAAINAGLSPKAAGEAHKFVLERDGAPLPVSLTSANLALMPVQNARVLNTASGAVGYLQFHDHNAVAESQLADAFRQFRSAQVSDLILDMRYNGGGYVRLAAELAYMIAGPTATQDKVFEQLHYNDKQKPVAPQLFSSTAYGFVPSKLNAGVALPALGLKRVTILTTAGTCSASESVINGLRGIDVDVTLIGGTTCGKPYAFTPAPNCGTTYFAIETQGTNNKGFGDYADGFQPTCNVADDLTHEVGDTSEGLLAAALSYRASGVCPATPQRNRTLSGPLEVLRPEGKQIAIRVR
ncbi:C-terminal processing protease CtpA/Prc [Duganella sp. 1224]|uniref:S41 family peptidase n=1 Tax=Duganella sp. 1224 TaxID=2587052 RepID=UPI00185D0394|nr:S41 family peptidase [Duganella sp. 1224]NYE63082.1 C-terminal processing protease CtpA/Prc [Duganella sp. 1224]